MSTEPGFPKLHTLAVATELKWILLPSKIKPFEVFLFEVYKKLEASFPDVEYVDLYNLDLTSFLLSVASFLGREESRSIVFGSVESQSDCSDRQSFVNGLIKQ